MYVKQMLFLYLLLDFTITCTLSFFSKMICTWLGLKVLSFVPPSPGNIFFSCRWYFLMLIYIFFWAWWDNVIIMIQKLEKDWDLLEQGNESDKGVSSRGRCCFWYKFYRTPPSSLKTLSCPIVGCHLGIRSQTPAALQADRAQSSCCSLGASFPMWFWPLCLMCSWVSFHLL